MRTPSLRYVFAATILILGAILIVWSLSGCQSRPENQYRRATDTREETFLRAEAAVPVPVTTDFPLRRALAKMTERQDLLNHPWYIYIFADTGNVLGYYVAQTVPVSTCAFLSSTERVYRSNNAAFKFTAPSLDGIYYGGAGASGDCGAFFFDAATDALIQLAPGVKYFVSDLPLLLQAEPILIDTSPQP